MGMTKRQTTTNYRKSPQTTANHREKKTTTHHRKPPQITTRIWDIGSETRDDAGKPPQTTANHCKPPPEFGIHDGYSCAGKKQLFCLSYMAHSKWPSHVGGARCFCEYRSFQILHIYDVSVVVCGDLRRLAL